MVSDAVRKVAVVTGAGQGIGRAIALRLAKDGFNVALGDLASNEGNLQKVAAEAEGLGAKALCVAVDVRKKEQVDKMIDDVVAGLGRVDVMVANAGIAPVGPFLELAEETLDNLYAVNVKGVLFCYQAAARQMIKQGEGGRLIAAASIAGLRSYPAFSGYSATKFAVRSFTQAAAVELGPYKITANCYCPAPVETNMWATIDKDLSDSLGVPVGSVTEQKRKENPQGHLPTTDEVAGLVSYLAGPDTSFISGQSMLVAGADTLW